MKITIAESEVEPVIKAVYMRLENIIHESPPGEEAFNLYRVLHRYKSEDEPIPEVITSQDIHQLLAKFNY
jgi:hypothetical protein